MYYTYMGDVLLPIAPNKLSVKIKNQNKTTVLIDGTEINFLKNAGLTEVEFEVLLPAVEYSFAKYDGGFKQPKYFTDHFEKLKVEKKPFQFILVRQMPNGKILHDTNMKVSLESYTVTENANEGFDTVVSIKLKQFRDFGTKTVKVVNPTNGVVVPTNGVVVPEPRPANPSPAPEQDTVIVVESEDTVMTVAKKVYGDGSLFGAIAMVNPDIMDDPTALEAGRLLKVPSVSKAKEIKSNEVGAISSDKLMTQMDFIKG